jgi:hypothetical protein
MRIGVVGSGSIGGTLAPLFAAAGHRVVVANTRGPDSLRDLVEAHPAIEAGTVADAAGAGELVVLAIPFGAYAGLPAEPFDGRVVVDAGNYSAQRDGARPELDRDEVGSSELLARQLPGARVVKAFNTIYFVRLRAEGDPALPLDERTVLPIAGDDAAAKELVGQLITDIGFAPLDLGPLPAGRRQQPGTPIYNVRLDLAQTRALLAGPRAGT